MSATAAAPRLSHPSRPPLSLERLRSGLASWHYSASNADARRDLRVDLLRGFCIFAMVVDHVGGESWLYAITGGNTFYVSAAEGFFFISGMVMGQAYAARVARSGLVAAMVEALKRARTLYVATVCLTLIFSALYLYTDITLWTGRDFGPGFDSFDELVVAALTLHYVYHGTEILANYTLLILASPGLFLLLALGQWRWALAVSWLWWAAYQKYPDHATLTWYIRHGENFPLAAWQVVFVTGLVLGYHRREVAAWLGQWPQLRLASLALGLAGSLAFIALYWVEQSGAEPHVPLPYAFPAYPFLDPDVGISSLGEMFYKVPLRPWRLVAFAAVAILAFTLVTYLWRPLRWATGWLLMPLGQHALYSYIVHYFLILFVYNAVPHLASLPTGLPVAVSEVVLQVLVVAVLWLLVRRRVLFGLVPN